jgi:sulfur carrier protein ThiS
MRVQASTLSQGRSSTVELAEGALASDLVRAVGLPVAASLVLRSGRPVPIDEPLVDGESLEVVYVASGG